MIKAVELMLGNVVQWKVNRAIVSEIRKDTVQLTVGTLTVSPVQCEDISPVALTPDVLGRLGMDPGSMASYLKEHRLTSVHELQIHNRANSFQPDWGVLLLPDHIFTTADGVEVWEGDLVYYTIINSNINPQQTIASKGNMDKVGYIFFSTLDACQSYIDSQTRKPIFTTEDGVDVFEGDEYWYCDKLGRGLAYSENAKESLFNKGNDNIRFSTKQLAQAYLNKVWAEKEYNDLISKKS